VWKSLRWSLLLFTDRPCGCFDADQCLWSGVSAFLFSVARGVRADQLDVEIDHPETSPVGDLRVARAPLQSEPLRLGVNPLPLLVRPILFYFLDRKKKVDFD
jgi:hypothetical protein